MKRIRSELRADRANFDGRHEGAPYPMTKTAIDLFEKARNHERARAAEARPPSTT